MSISVEATGNYPTGTNQCTIGGDTFEMKVA